jgi:lysozyme
VNAAGLALLKSFEKCRLTAYLPTPNDKPTIGWGHCGPEVHLGLTWTQAQADAQLAADLRWRDEKVAQLTEGCLTTDNQHSAMVSLAYNIGFGDPAKNEPGFTTSTVLRRHRLGNHAGAADAFMMWIKQKGKVLPGLVRRRSAERELYLS